MGKRKRTSEWDRFRRSSTNDQMKPLLLGLGFEERERDGATQNKARRHIREEYRRKEEEIRNACAPSSTSERHYPQVLKALPFPGDE